VSEALLRQRIRDAVTDEAAAGSDYREVAALARRLGHDAVADAFEDAARDEERHDRVFTGFLRGGLR
jgi:rubrerythrin